MLTSFPVNQQPGTAPGTAHYFLGDFESAEKHLTSLEKRQSAKGEDLFWLALVKHRQGDVEAASDLFTELEETSADRAAAFETALQLPLPRALPNPSS